MIGAKLIEQERARQMFEKGYRPEHDDQHGAGSLLVAGVLIGCDVAGHALAGVDPPDLNGPWPDALLLHVREKYAGDEVRQLVIAGALFAAEIDRLLRAAERAESTHEPRHSTDPRPDADAPAPAVPG